MKKFVIILLFMLLYPVVYAELTINYPQNINTIAGQEKNFSMAFNNTFTYDLYQVQITDTEYFSWFEPFNMTANSVVNKTYFLTIPDQRTQTTTPILLFYGITTGTTQPVTYEIYVDLANSTPISNNNLSMKVGDTVRFYNYYTSNITITDNVSNLWFTIPVGQSQQKVIDTEGQLYYLIDFAFLGEINVATNTITNYIHDPLYDQTLTFNIDSKYNQSAFSIEPLINDFDIDYNETIEGVIKITTDKSIYDMTLNTTSEWITFDETRFNVSETKLINFDLKPTNITLTSQTNKEYTIDIIANTLNAGSNSTKIKVKVDYFFFNTSEDYEDNTTIIFAGDAELQAFCIKYPERCPTRNVTQIVYVNKTDETTTQIEDLDDKLRSMDNRMGVFESDISEVKSAAHTISSGLEGINQYNTRLEQEKDKQETEDFWRAFWKWTRNILIALVLIIFVTTIYLKRKLDDNKMLAYG